VATRPGRTQAMVMLGMSIIKKAAKCCHFSSEQQKSPRYKSTARKSTQRYSEFAGRQEGNDFLPPTRARFSGFWVMGVGCTGFGVGFSSSLSWLLACNSHVLARTILLMLLLLPFCCWHFDLSI